VSKTVMGITLGASSESEEEEIYSMSSIMMDVVLRVCKGAGGVGLFTSTILKLRTLSLRSVMENLHGVRKEGTAVKVSK
jgi:hypothetical protein